MVIAALFIGYVFRAYLRWLWHRGMSLMRFIDLQALSTGDPRDADLCPAHMVFYFVISARFRALGRGPAFRQSRLLRHRSRLGRRGQGVHRVVGTLWHRLRERGRKCTR